MEIHTPMKVRIKRVDPSLPLPKHETTGSVGFDLVCREAAAVPPGEIRLIPANVIVEVPQGYMLMVAARSSLPLKRGLMISNGVGVIDQDYHGPEDEIRVQVYNFTEHPVEVDRGDRLAQGILVRVAQVAWQEVQEMDQDTRGGFGSTG